MSLLTAAISAAVSYFFGIIDGRTNQALKLRTFPLSVLYMALATARLRASRESRRVARRVVVMIRPSDSTLTRCSANKTTAEVFGPKAGTDAPVASRSH